MWDVGPLPTGLITCLAGGKRPYLIFKNALTPEMLQSDVVAGRHATEFAALNQ